jgi:hypothetical protein
MDARELRAYRNRWHAVAAIEKEEQRQATLAFRWRQLNRLTAMAAALGLRLIDRREELDTVRRRWNLLKDLAQGYPGEQTR